MVQRPVSAVAVVCLLFILLYLVPLGLRPLLIPDEARYAQIPREMIRNHTWLIPQFADMPYYEKPSGGYWTEIAAQKILGESNFTIRLPYALAAAVTLLLTWLIARRFRDDEPDGRFHGLPLYSVLTLMVTGEFFIISTTAVLDGVFTACVTAEFVFFYLAWSEKKSPGISFLWLFLCGLAVGCAFLIKGFLAFALPGLGIAAFLLWERDYRSFLTKPWVPFLASLLVIVPWGLATAEAAPDFWHYFVVVEHYQRFFREVSSQHPEPFFYFIPVILGGAMPFTLFCVPLFLGGRELPWKHSSLLKYSAAWIILPFLFLSLSTGKLATYILPLFPPVALIAALCMLGAQGKENALKYFNITVKFTAGILAVGLIGFLITNFAFHPVYGTGQMPLLGFTVLCVILFLAILLRAIREKTMKDKYLTLVIAMFFLMPAWQAGLPEIVMNQKAPEVFLKESVAKIPPNAILMTRDQFLGILLWTTGRNDLRLFYKTGEFEYGLNHSPDKEKRFVSVEKFKEMLDNPASRDYRPVAVYVTAGHEKRYNTLPQFRQTISNGEISLMLFE